MPIATTISLLLLKHVGGAAAKFLLTNWLGADLGGLAGSGVDLSADLSQLAGEQFNDAATQREMTRQFEALGDKIARQLEPLFEKQAAPENFHVEAVIIELEKTLQGRISAEFFLTHDLNPAKLGQAFRDAYVVPDKRLYPVERNLYEQALDTVVRFIVGAAQTLPKYQVARDAENLRRLSQIGADVDKTLETVGRIEQLVVQEIVEPKAREAARFEADYRHAVTQNLDYLELFGADILPESRRHSLSVAYVSLNLQRQGKQDSAGDMLPAEAALDDLRPDAGRLLVRGEAGSGKSTLFRWAAINAALSKMDAGRFAFHFNLRAFKDLVEQYFPGGSLEEIKHVAQARLMTAKNKLTREHRLNWIVRIPFLIRLRDCTGGKLPAPDEFPELVAKQLGHPPQGWVRDVLQAGRGLVLLDGVDEIPGEFRDATLYGEIDAIMKAFPKNYFLVSTRPEAVPDGWLAGLGFREARINPMSDTDKGRFIDKWHEAVRDELAKRGAPSAETALGKLADELKEKLAESPPINRLATNPLMCAMICALHRERRQKLPDSQSELVEALCHMLLHRRELESGLQLDAFPEPYRQLSYPHKKLIVQDLAYHMVVNKQESVIARDEAERLMRDRLARIGGRPDDAPVVLRTLAERSGMLREATPKTAASSGTLDFVHNTFKEYLAGVRLAEEGADGLLADNATKPGWLPVLLFAAATERKGFATSLIEKILAEPDASASKVKWKSRGRGRPRRVRVRERKDRQRRLIALRCRAVALDLDPKVRKRLDKDAKALVPPRTMADAEALGACGEVALPFLKFQPELTKKQAAACVRALCLIQIDPAPKYLRGYLVDARWQVVTELAQAMNPLEIPAVQQMVQEPHSYEKYLKQLSIRQQIIDLSPLAGLSGLTTLYLFDTPVSDLSPLAGLADLQMLSVWGKSVSDEALAAFQVERKRRGLQNVKIERL